MKKWVWLYLAAFCFTAVMVFVAHMADRENKLSTIEEIRQGIALANYLIYGGPNPLEECPDPEPAIDTTPPKDSMPAYVKIIILTDSGWYLVDSTLWNPDSDDPDTFIEKTMKHLTEE